MLLLIHYLGQMREDFNQGGHNFGGNKFKDFLKTFKYLFQTYSIMF